MGQGQWTRYKMGQGTRTMDPVHNGTGDWDNGSGTQWDEDTIGRAHNGTGAQFWTWYTMGHGQWTRYAMGQGHNGPDVHWFWYTIIQGHNGSDTGT